MITHEDVIKTVFTEAEIKRGEEIAKGLMATSRYRLHIVSLILSLREGHIQYLEQIAEQASRAINGGCPYC